MDDEKLAVRLKCGDTAALSAIIDKYAGYVAGILRSFLGSGLSREDLEEISADVFLNLWKARGLLKPGGNLKAYIAAAARNTGRKRLKKLKAVEPIPDEFVSFETGPEEAAEENEKIRFASELLSNLSPQDRRIFIRYYYLGQRVDEISKCTGLRSSTVMSRLFRGRKKMKEKTGGIEDY